MKAEAARTESDSVLKQAKAAHTIAQTREIAGADPSKDKEMELEQQKHNQEMTHDEQKHQQTMAHDEQKMQLQMAIKAKEAADKARMMKAQTIMAERQKHKPAAKKAA